MQEETKDQRVRIGQWSEHTMLLPVKELKCAPIWLLHASGGSFSGDVCVAMVCERVSYDG